MVSQTPQLEPIVPAYRVRILSDEQLDQFKSNTFYNSGGDRCSLSFREGTENIC